MTRQIDKPLGQDLGPAPSARRPRPVLPLGALAVAVALAGVAAFVALRPDPAGTPVVVLAPEPAPADVAAPVAEKPPVAVRVNPGEAGPAIIKVNPAPATDEPIVIRDPSRLGVDPRMAHLPDRALIEQSEYGPLPRRAADGRRPFDAYAGAWSGKRGVRVAIVIGGLGLSQTGTQAALRKLPGEVTLAFAPSGNSLQRWMQAARQASHEIVLQVPLEPFDFPRVNPGRNTLTVSASGDENVGLLRWALGRTTNYAGVMNYMGARFTADEASLAPVMAELSARGLAYIDDGSSARSKAGDLALTHRVPFAAADTLIDATPDRAAVLAALDDLERTARARGGAIGVGSAFDTTIDAVAEWIAGARKRGVEIVPVSALALDPEKG